MQLSELFQALSYGVLSNLAIGDSGSGEIPTEHQPKVIFHTNQALVQLFQRFLIREREVLIAVQDGYTLYPLNSIHSLTVGTDPRQFIMDTPDNPFTDDVAKITKVMDEDWNEEFLNNQDEHFSLFTPEYNVLQIPEPVDNDMYFVQYQALHPKILDNSDLTQVITIHPALIPALHAYIGYCVFNPMNGDEHRAKASELYSTYELICSRADEKDLLTTSFVRTGEKLDDRGFV